MAKSCVQCGNSFTGAYHGQYCSNSCKQKAYRERNNIGKKNGEQSKNEDVNFKKYTAKSLQQNGYVYLMRKIGSDICKIGITNSNPNFRLMEVIFDVHFPVELVHYAKVKNAPVLEKFLHVQFSEKKIELGTEWFELSSRDIESAKMLMAFQHAT